MTLAHAEGVPVVFHVRSMSVKDLEFAVQITGKMGWDLVDEDFKFMMELEPEGCFVALHDSERIGLATTVSFGKIGWFGNLVVNENYRNKGIGSLLVTHSMNYLHGKNVETVGLYAYENRIHFYTRIGFKCDSDFTVMKGKGFPSAPDLNVKKADGHDVKKIIEYDKSCFGGSRRKLLEPILLDSDNLCFVAVEGNMVSGYVVAKIYRGVAELGPFVCSPDQDDLAIGLLKTMFNRLSGLQVSLFLPSKETPIINMLKGNGFTEEFCVARMYHGTALAMNCIRGAESLERG